MEEWATHWQGCALGNCRQNIAECSWKLRTNFMAMLLKACAQRCRLLNGKRKHFIQQMCQVRVRVSGDLKVAMPMTQAIALGILDTETVESIARGISNRLSGNKAGHFGTNSNVSSRITREMPMHRFAGMVKILRFWVPPVLHASVKRLLLVSSVFSEQHLHRVFS